MIRSPRTILALLTGLNFLNYIDRLVVSAILPKIKDGLGLSNLEAGLLATAFLVSYIATSPLFGALADRGRRMPLVAIGVGLWCVATVASGLAPTKLTLFAARAMVGVGEASYATIAPTLIDDVAPPHKRARWLSIFFAATPIGGALGFILGGALGEAYGWRTAFMLVGGPGILLALLCLAVREPARVVPRTRDNLLTVAREILPLFLFRRTMLGYCAQTAAIVAFSHWAPTYLAAQHGIPVDRASYLFGTVTVVGGAIGTALGGVWADRMNRRDFHESSADNNATRAFLRVCAWGSILAAPTAAIAIASGSMMGFLVPIFFCEVGLFMATAPVNAAVLRSVPEHRRASAMALTILLMYVLGGLWMPAAIGLIADHAPMQLAMGLLPVAIGLSAMFWWVRTPPRTAAPSALG